jgi:2',3'-cyclic-nucleotide 2'-phosphodiesterase (5'-nucleotidase family)
MAKADLLLKAYADQNCAGIGLGDRDLSALGVEVLKGFAKAAKFPFINANLVVAKSGEPVFTPNVVVERAGMKIGIFGILTAGANLADKEYELLAPVDAAREQVKQLQDAGAEVVVMLAHLDRRDAGQVVKEVPGIDVVLGGQSMGTSRFIERLQDAWWVEPGQKGKHLAVVTLNMTKGGKRPFVVREESQKLSEELKAVDQRIERYVKLANGPSKPGTRTANKDRFKGVISSLERQRKELVEKATKIAKAAPDSPFLSLEMVAMNKKLRDDEEIATWVSEFKAKYDVKKGRAATLPHPDKPLSRATRPGRAINHKAIRSTGPKEGTKGTSGGTASKTTKSNKSTKVKKVVRPK